MKYLEQMIEEDEKMLELIKNKTSWRGFDEETKDDENAWLQRLDKMKLIHKYLLEGNLEDIIRQQ